MVLFRYVVRLFLLTIIGLVASSCIRLSPSLYQSTPALFSPDNLAPVAHFYAYANNVNTFYSYSTKDKVWTSNTYTGVAGMLDSVAKTTGGFVGVDYTLSTPNTSVYLSTDGLNWTTNYSYAGTSGVAKVAACGDNVVVAYNNSIGLSIDVVTSSDGGATFSSPVTGVFVGSTTTLYDLVCQDNIFHISVGGAGVVTYKYSTDFGTTWNAPTTNPNSFSSALQNLAINGTSILGYYQSTSPTLSQSIDTGKNWTDTGITIFSGYNYAIGYASGYFYAPYVSGFDGVMNRSSDNGLTWDPTPPTITGIFSVGNIYNIDGGDGTIVAVGQDAGNSVIITSTDNGATFARENLGSDGIILVELLKFYE